MFEKILLWDFIGKVADYLITKGLCEAVRGRLEEVKVLGILN